MNKKLITTIFALFFITAATAQEAKATTAPAEANTTTEAATPAPTTTTEDAVTFDLETGIYSKYVWRGLTLSDDVVNQGSATASYKGFSFNLWYNLDATDQNEQEGEVSEIDFTLSYAGQINETIAYETGVIYYEFPNDADETAEVFLGFSFDTFLNPSITVYYDFIEADGFYADLGIGHAFSITESISLELGANLGIMDDGQSSTYLGENTDGTNVSNITFSAALPIELNETFTLTPAVYFNSLVSGNNDEESADDENVYTSINISASF